MALPINIEDLLNKRKIEGNRIEFFAEQSDKVERKKGWNVTEVERRASLIGMPRWSNVIEYNPRTSTTASVHLPTTSTTWVAAMCWWAWSRTATVWPNAP